VRPLPARSRRFQGGLITSIEDEARALERGNIAGLGAVHEEQGLRVVGIAAARRQPNGLTRGIAFARVRHETVVAKRPQHVVEFFDALRRASAHERAPATLQTFLQQRR